MEILGAAGSNYIGRSLPFFSKKAIMPTKTYALKSIVLRLIRFLTSNHTHTLSQSLSWSCWRRRAWDWWCNSFLLLSLPMEYSRVEICCLTRTWCQNLATRARAASVSNFQGADQWNIFEWNAQEHQRLRKKDRGELNAFLRDTYIPINWAPCSPMYICTVCRYDSNVLHSTSRPHRLGP